jgi:hypothetical protein
MLLDGMAAVRAAALGPQVVLHARLAEGVPALQEQGNAHTSVIHRRAHPTLKRHGELPGSVTWSRESAAAVLAFGPELQAPAQSTP